jgi:hypothetical protein
MADNLSINIVADTSKARAEMELLNAKMRATQKEIKATSDVAQKTADPAAIAKVRTLSATYDGMSKQVARLRKEVNATTKAVEGFHHAAHPHEFYLVENSLKSLSGAFQAIGHNIIGAKGAIAGFAVALGFEKVRDIVNEVSERLGELKKQAGEIGIKPIALQAAQEVVTGIGEEADIATKAMQGMNAQIEAARQKSIMPPGQVSVFKGGAGTTRVGVPGGPGVQVGRGGVEQPRDFSDPLAMIGASLSDIPNNRLAQLQTYTRQLQAFVNAAKTFDPTALNIISKTLFAGVPADSMLKAAPALLKQWKAQIADLEQAQRGATDETLKQDEELRASKDKLSKSYSEAAAIVANTLRPAQLAFNDVLSTALTRDATQFQTDIANLTHAWQSFWTEMTSIASAAASSIQSIFQGLARASSAVSAGLANPGSNISEPFGGGISGAIGGALPGDYSADTGGFARGGFVRGPGSGTSDSILARLSAGEFVVNSARVRQVGLGFLQRLNGFADGGFVGLAPLRFAAGGLVPSAGGGRAVHLHLGGGSFALAGSGSVVDALVSAAHSQQIRSAGVKPSWFAARPGG